MQNLNLKPAFFALALIVAAVVGASGEHLIERVSSGGGDLGRTTAVECVPGIGARTS